MVGSSRPSGAVDESRMNRMQDAVRKLISGIGEDLEREGLIDTPKRVAKAFIEMSVGYRQDVASVLNNAIFHEEEVGTSSNGIVLVRDIDFAALSEDTLMPFYGRCHVAYLPSSGAVLGLSKLARITKLFAKRLQTQGQLGQQVLQCMQQQLEPLGVAVVLQAKHLGFGGADVQHFTAAVNGVFATEPSSQLQELLLMLDLEEAPLAVTRVPQQCSCKVCRGPAAGCAPACSNAKPRSPASSPEAIDLPDNSLDSSMLGLALDTVEAPTTPDPSEGDEEPPVAELEEAASSSNNSSSSEHPAGDVDASRGAASAECSSGPASSSCSKDMESAVEVLLQEIGEDPSRPALQAAVRRYVSHLLASTSGYRKQPQQQAEAAGDEQQSEESQASASREQQAAAAYRASSAAAQQQEAAGSRHSSSNGAAANGSCHQQQEPADSIHHFSSSFASQCEHHMLPFQGSVHIAYTLPPGAAPVPAQQLQQLVAMYTRRLQLQERITHQLLHGVAQLTCASGVMVVCEAAHMCMVARGVENHSGATMSNATLGAFSRSAQLRSSVLRRARQQLGNQRARVHMLQGLGDGTEQQA